MGYLFLEIWLLLLIAFGLGMFVQWWFCCRTDEDQELDQNVTELPSTNNTAESENNSNKIESTLAPASVSVGNGDDNLSLDDNWKPVAFSTAPESVDDLKRIKGIGAVIEKTLNELGIYQFKQIADWNPDNVAWVEGFLSFQGRIGREEWISQAKTLASGESTDFAERVDDGKVDY